MLNEVALPPMSPYDRAARAAESRRKVESKSPKCHQPSYRKMYGGTCVGFEREPHDVKHTRRGLCRNCYQRADRRGVLNDVALPPKHQRERMAPHALPVGTRYVHPKSGYVEIKMPPGQGDRRGDWMFEHKAVMEQMLGRPLVPGENVHHKNRIRSDNRPENLELWITGQPCGGRLQDMTDWMVNHHRHAVIEALQQTGM